MISKIFCLIFVLNWIWCEAAKKDEFEDLNGGKAPFFEIPCMRIGGICARGFACPPGTKVGRRGLCPDQQQHGMECCRPIKVQKKCSSRNGDCMPKTFKCPINMRIDDVTDCKATEICCVYEQ